MAIGPCQRSAGCGADPGDSTGRREPRDEEHGDHDGQVPYHDHGDRDPAGRQQVPAAGVFLTAGDPGGGEQPSYPGEDGEDGARSPDSEPTRIVQRDRLAEEGTDSRVLGQRGKRRPVPGRLSTPGGGVRTAAAGGFGRGGILRHAR
ncbi:hypothetical protein Pma05_09990 [Plantactinospora mayteni]|uniref:Uncharacterized protein n=1 Tax=Plantactinospora mayteni TaxID=566021 RepID=A0ABQ4EJK5_9ACTN|nr:hypothetical protein Pma05_09990 [Plantactinospora mayteni]